ncbi:T9SS type A sorting domain-containing protein [candidate division WOR-3 bacterium]|nr:T9SS type A sorting domain-containing protein [candidate division WOR-3 bacterium]
MSGLWVTGHKVSDAIRTRDFVRGLFYDNGSQRLYIAAGVAGLEVWDISDPNLPVQLGGCDTPGSACGVAVSGSYAYIADGYTGLQIYQNLLVGVEETVLTGGGVRVLQNPIPGDYIHLSFEIPQSDNISLSLYNIAGQRIKSFSPSPLSSNSHTVRLPLYELSNGIYFLRIKGMTLNETIKLIRVR